MDQQLQTLIELQAYDARIAALEAEAARLPKQLEAIQQGLAEAKKAVEGLKAKADTTRKDLRAKEQELEVTSTKRSKADAKLWEVKTNKEYSAALLEIEAIKQEKAQNEEEILALMETQEHFAVDLREAEARHREREAQAREDEGVVRKKLEAVEAELTVVRAERNTRARELPQGVLTDYERILKARAGVAVAQVNASAICGGCRVSIRPQALQELRVARDLMRCESCGRYLYWQE
ncbi:MAG: zinc ribbon domain-containing protein [Candidatus Rokuibacteriota bacterium]